MPFYPSPDRDDGYDITDFYGVDPRLGTLGDFVEFVRTARDRGIRVIADLVVNHTSVEHPWFQSGPQRPTRPTATSTSGRTRSRPSAPAASCSRTRRPELELDEKAGQYYLHRFYSLQPDLNVANPQVRDEIAQIMGFWLELGLSGFRVATIAIGASRASATTAAFTPPPLAVTSSANAAGNRQRRGSRTPRHATSTSHGRSAYASSVIDVRFVKTTT